MGRYDSQDVQKLWSRVDKSGECWTWQGAANQYGYGHMKVRDGLVQVHRMSWEIENGQIPEGLCICHTCDNPPCVRPDHLWLGTRADNNADKIRKGRAIYVPMSPEEKIRRGFLYRGRKDSPETRAKKSAAQRGNQKSLGYRNTPEQLTHRSLARGGPGPVTYAGVLYPSPTSAARAAGVTPNTFIRWVREFGTDIPLMSAERKYEIRHRVGQSNKAHAGRSA